MIARQKPAIRPALCWYGGKYFLKDKLIDLMPQHKVYVEPFAGGATILLNKLPCSPDVLSDANEHLIAFYQLLQTDPEYVIDYIKSVDHCGEAFDFAQQKIAESGPITKEQATCFLITTRLSWGGAGTHFAWANQFTKDGLPTKQVKWDNVKKKTLPRVIERLQGVRVLCDDAVNVIQDCDSEETLFYCDPPYLHHTRQTSSRAMYVYEMSDNRHRLLAQTLRGCKGFVIVSGYPSSLYTKWYKGWTTLSWNMVNRASTRNVPGFGTIKRRETIWCNFNIHSGKKLT